MSTARPILSLQAPWFWEEPCLGTPPYWCIHFGDKDKALFLLSPQPQVTQCSLQHCGVFILSGLEDKQMGT